MFLWTPWSVLFLFIDIDEDGVVDEIVVTSPGLDIPFGELFPDKGYGAFTNSFPYVGHSVPDSFFTKIVPRKIPGKSLLRNSGSGGLPG
jgi:hypothetical protein